MRTVQIKFDTIRTEDSSFGRKVFRFYDPFTKQLPIETCWMTKEFAEVFAKDDLEIGPSELFAEGAYCTFCNSRMNFSHGLDVDYYIDCLGRIGDQMCGATNTGMQHDRVITTLQDVLDVWERHDWTQPLFTGWNDEKYQIILG